ncbi:hypothetical protein, partial [Klebsiella pneumoniae]|uniref:hypothetical protein n=1 Tax=Klebsiella pneumoniae TaxID=573 RepID=UPI001C90D396
MRRPLKLEEIVRVCENGFGRKVVAEEAAIDDDDDDEEEEAWSLEEREKVVVGLGFGERIAEDDAQAIVSHCRLILSLSSNNSTQIRL